MTAVFRKTCGNSGNVVVLLMVLGLDIARKCRTAENYLKVSQ